MALSASAGTLLRWSPAAENSRTAVSRQPGDYSHRLYAASPSKRVLNSNGSNKSINAQRLLSRQRHRGRERLLVVRASEDNSSNNQKGETGTTSSEVDVEALEARLGVGRRARKQQAESGSPPQGSKPAAPAKPSQPAKAWDSMSLAEKAWSLYIDPDKGVLFWLNKLAYGAIFAVIGGWIVFRFIGPALGWYELDAPLLSPDRLLDGP